MHVTLRYLIMLRVSVAVFTELFRLQNRLDHEEHGYTFTKNKTIVLHWFLTFRIGEHYHCLDCTVMFALQAAYHLRGNPASCVQT
jgi:hypothetical protein